MSDSRIVQESTVNTPVWPRASWCFAQVRKDESVKESLTQERHPRRPDRKNPNPKLSDDDDDDDEDDEEGASGDTTDENSTLAFLWNRGRRRRRLSARCLDVGFVGPSGLELVSYPRNRPIKKPAAHRTPIGRLRPP